uniref:hypothetical protein n=1 Tax=Pedobacter schmidteae TaxID=2201271 RepID=UPI000EABA7F3|nr:hypothetical protein [Pedobacter schmidteae]
MKISGPTYPHQKNYSKWLFAAILILSFFNFSGFSISIAQVKSDTQQTGSLGNVKAQTAKSISYKRALNHINRSGDHSIWRLNSPSLLAIIHTRLLHNQIALYSKPPVNLKKISLFYQAKSVASNDDDELNAATA